MIRRSVRRALALVPAVPHRIYISIYVDQEGFAPQRRILNVRADLGRLNGVLGGAADLRDLAETVARHKQYFFPVRCEDGTEVDYLAAVRGHLRVIPDGSRLAALAVDYERMVGSGMLSEDAPRFDEVMVGCAGMAPTIE